MRTLFLPLLFACGQVSLGSSAGSGGAAGGAPGPGGSGGSLPDPFNGDAPVDAGGVTARPAPDAGLPLPPSCRQAPACGVEGVSCCTATVVPAGSYTFGLRDTTSSASRAAVSALGLDTFEVTLARYREFASDYDRWRAEQNPTVGAGAHPEVDGSGWQAAWNAALPVNSAALEQDAVVCAGSGISTWAAGVPDAAMNCLTWFEAFAFCAWDGGRLPLQSEWEYAAVGGSEQREYPWGNAPEPTDELAAFGCADEREGCSPPGPGAVGSHPSGAGRWGQQDLAGSVSEWLLDVPGTYPAACESCALVDESLGPPGGQRIVRGASWADEASALAIADRSGAPAGLAVPIFGVRCARDVP